LKKRYFLLFLALLGLVIPLQQVDAVNEVTKIIKLRGSLIGTLVDEEFLLPESLTNLNKTITFMSVRHLGDGNAKEIYRSWDFINNTAIGFHGSDNFPANNAPMDFVAYFVEFTAGSDMIVQNGTLIVDGADVNQEFIATLSPSVNATNSFYMFEGLTMDHTDLSWGSEEFGIMRVKNDTSWGYEPANAPNSGDTEVRFSVIDWNNSNFIIQNGTGALQDLDLIDTIVPSPAIDRRHTIVLISTSFDGEEDATSDEYGVTGRINSSNEVEIEREDADCGSGSNCIVNYRWELITFPTTFANVTHDQIFKTTITGSDVTVSTIDIFSPALGNANNSIAIGTNHNPMGLGQARDSSGSSGTWDRNAYTIELVNATAVNGTANDARNDATIPYQVIEFLAPAGQIFDQIITDVVSAVDQGTQFIVNKTQADTATTSDAVLSAVVTIFNETATDTATTTDTLILDVTKIIADTATVSDQTIVIKTGVLNQTASDISTVVDQLQITITKIITETATTSDSVITNLIVNQTATEVVVVNDNVITSLTSTFNETAIDTATVTDLVVTMLTSTKELLDIISTSDSIIVTFNTTIVTPPSGGGGGGSTSPSNFQRIQGLQIQSEEFEVNISDTIPSEFIITWFGQETVGVSVTDIEPNPDFDTWFIIQPLPQDLDNAVKIDNLKLSIDPTRITNIALQPYVLNVPTIRCNITLDPNVPCFEEILYEIPIDFTFNKGGFPFEAIHIVTVDGRSLIGKCIVFGFETIELVCDFIKFLEENWWWLASIAFVLMIVSIIWKRGGTNVRVVRRTFARDLQSMSGERIRKRKKFKKR